MPFDVIDAHAHCGKEDRFPPQDFESYLSAVRGSLIGGVVLFPPVAEIYDRYDYHFVDTPEWQARRRSANEYVLSLEGGELEVFPYFFIWNDFAVEQLTDRHCGIKWHRHGDEPRYRYEDPRCRKALDEIRRRNLPVCLEEEWSCTLDFINHLAPELRVVIPHCGLLNGGFDRFCRLDLWGRPNIYTDTSLVPSQIIAAYVNRYGSERILFGSDYPFGDPIREYLKILKMDLGEAEKGAILAGNIRELFRGVDSWNQTPDTPASPR